MEARWESNDISLTCDVASESLDRTSHLVDLGKDDAFRQSRWWVTRDGGYTDILEIWLRDILEHWVL
jgi:hypothetical protein